MRKLYAFLLTAFLVISGTMIRAQVSVTATGGTLGPTAYTNLSSAFTAINAGTHQGVVTVDISASFTDVATAVLNSSGAGSASYTSVLVRPSSDGVVVNFTTASGSGVIELNGADNVTIDGDNPNTGGTNRNLTITNSAANTITFTSVIRLATSTLVTSCDNVTIRNCIINGSGTGRNLTGLGEVVAWGIIAAGNASTVLATTAPTPLSASSTTIASGQTALNFVVNNNAVSTCSRGISFNGAAVTVCPILTVTNNTVGNPVAGATDQVYLHGITVQGFNTGTSISGNTVYVESFIGTTLIGIDNGVISANGTNAIFENNVIGRVKNSNTGGFGAYGFNLLSSTATTNNTFRNNFVIGVMNTGTASFSTTFGCFGFRMAAGTSNKIYHNSVYMFGNNTGTGSNIMACFGITSTTATGADVRNNIFANTATQSGAPSGSANVCVYLPSSATVSLNLTINNNAYYTGITAGVSGVAHVGTSYNANAQGPATYSGLYLATGFNPGATSPNSNFRAYTSILSAAGTNDNASFASASTPPFVSTSNLHIPAGTISSIESHGASIGVTTDIDGDTRPGPAGSTFGGAVNPDMGADEFDGVYCTVSVSVSPPTPQICIGSGTPATLTASGAVTYSWAPSTGLSATTGAVVTANPVVTTSYLVTGTAANGCTASAAVTVTVNGSVMAAVSPTTANVCAGTPTTLNATAGNTSAYTGSVITYAPIPTPGSGVTTLVNAGAGTPTSAGDYDDGRWDNISLPFNFEYFGAVYNTVNIGTNGWIAMGSVGSSTTGYNNALPSLNNPNAVIDAVNGDLDERTVGTVQYFTTGSAPNRKFVINFTGVGFFSGGGTATVQAILYESTQVIEVHTTSVSNSSTNKAQAIESTSGAVAVIVPGRNNTAAWVGMPDAYRFTPSGGTYTFSWSPSAGLNTTVGPTVIATPASTTTYTATATETTSGCQGTATSTITVTSLPLVTSQPVNRTICANQTTTFSVATNIPPSAYQWQIDNGSGFNNIVDNAVFSGSQTATLTVTNPSVANSGSIKCNITTGCGPLTSNTVTLTVNPIPTISVIGTSGLCGPQPFAAFGTSDTYSWAPAAGLNTTTGPIVIASPTVTTTYTVTGTITATGCQNTATVSVLATPPTPIINPNPVTICAGQIQSLTVTNAVSFPATQTFTNVGVVTIPATGSGTSTGAPATPYPSVLSVSGLPATGVTVKSVTINGITHTFPSDVDIVLQSPTGTNVILMSDIGGGSALAGVNYTFDDAAGSNLGTGFNASGTYKPTNIVGGLGVEPDNWPAPGPGAVAQPTPTLSTFSGNANGTWNLYIVDDFGGDIGSISGWSITFAYSTGSITWSPNTSLFTDPAATIPYVLGTPFNTVYTKAVSTITYNATATIGTCTAGPTSVVVTVKPSPVISVAPNNQCAPVTLTASGNADVYTWLPITGLNTTNGPVVIASPNATTTYTVTGTFNSNGCSSTASAIVKGNSQSAVLSANGVPNLVINEGFDVMPPPNWVITNLSSPVGGTSWFQGNPAVFPSHSGGAAAYAGANFNNTGTTGTISDWFITPTVTLVNGATISFWTRTFDGTFPDRLQLRMSTSGASTNVGTLSTDVGAFTNLLVEVNPNLTTVDYPTVWTKFTATISGLGGPTTGRFAFRYFVTGAGLFGSNSDYIGLDDVQYATPTAPTICNGQSGSLTVTITGGNGPFTVVYSNGTTNTTVAGYTSGSPIPVSPSVNTTYSLVSVTNASGCLSPGLSGTPLMTVNPLPTVTVGPNNQCGPVNLTAASTINPATFAWTPASGLSATTGATVNANPAVNTTYTVTGTVTATGCLNTASATVNATPGAPTIVPSSATICLGGPPVKLTATPGVGSSNSVTSSGAISVAIPDNSVVGATSSLAVSGIPVNATINSVSVNFNITHTFVSDLVINLKAPNGNILNLVDFEGGAGDNFTNTTISSTSVNPLSADVPPFTGTYAADRLFGFGPTGFVANVTNWSDMFSIGNGTWTLAMEDFAGADLGTLTSWSVTINYTPAVVWTPITGLFTNSAGTTAYVAATPLSVVWANPATTTTYSASSTLGSCVGTATNVVVTVVQPPVITTQPANQTACVGTNATFSVVATSNFLNYQWQQSVNAGVTFTNIAGATNASLTLNAVTLAMNNNQYRVIISNSCFTATSNAATLTVNPLPVVTVNALQNRICLGDTIPLVGTPVGGFWSGPGVSGFNFIASATAVGNWTLTYSYTNNNGCTNTATTVANVFDCQERIRLLSDDGVQLFPNPNNGRFFIRMNSTLYNYLGMRVYTDAGQLLRVQNFTGLGWGRVVPIDLSSFPAGVYMVKIYYDDGPRSSDKTFRVVVTGH